MEAARLQILGTEYFFAFSQELISLLLIKRLISRSIGEDGVLIFKLSHPFSSRVETKLFRVYRIFFCNLSVVTRFGVRCGAVRGLQRDMRPERAAGLAMDQHGPYADALGEVNNPSQGQLFDSFRSVQG